MKYLIKKLYLEEKIYLFCRFFLINEVFCFFEISYKLIINIGG